MPELSTDLWESTLSSIASRIQPHNFDLWLRPIQCVEVGDGRIRLRAPNRYIKEWFEDNYLPAVREALLASTRKDYRITFEEGSLAPAPEPEPAAPAPKLHPSLNPKYTFETFVTGPSNQLAHAAALAAAEFPGERWNPLFVYGGVGLGKTHLAQAIGHHVHRRNPLTRILYVSSERFLGEFIDALGQKRLDDFRRRYRDDCDILLIDDIQFLAGKDATQIEFFHTFNVLYDSRRQIVLTSDQLPQDIEALDERLRSRFSQGLIADVRPPELETRIAILLGKAAADGVALPDDVARFVASVVRSNVRDLEGALSRIIAQAAIANVPISVESARAALAHLVRAHGDHVSIDAVQKEVANYFGVKIADLRGPKRHRTITNPRQIAMYLARHLCDASFPEIGHRFGGKDHSTVISACRNVARRMAEDPAVKGTVEQLQRNLRG